MTKFTIEDLRDIAYRGSYDDLERELALQLLASMEQTPVYLRPFGDDGETFVACDADDERAIPLYAAPQLPQPAVVIEGLYKIANHIASCKGGMPEEWQDWAEEIESDMRRISLQPVPDKMTAIVKDEHDYVEGWNACLDAMLQGAEPVQPYTLRDGWVAVPVDMAPEMMRAVQINSELGAYAAANLTGAYSLFREFWDVAIAAAPQQEEK